MARRKSGAPVPAELLQREPGRPGPTRYHFHKLAPGDSLFQAGEFRTLKHSPMYQTARKYSQRVPGFEFRAKRYPDGVRIWRTDGLDAPPTNPDFSILD